MTELFDPLDGKWLLNKFEIYKTLRNKDTAYWSEKYQMHVVTRYDDVVYALSNPDIFSSAQGNLIIETEPGRFGNTLGASDNPAHDTYKNIVKEAYSKENINRVCNLMGEKARELIAGKSEVNISEVIGHLSAWVTAEILNIPHDKEKVKDFIVDIQRHADQAVKYNTNNHTFDSLKEIIFVSVYEAQTPASGPGIYQEYVKHKPNKFHITALFMGPTLSGAASMSSALEFLTLDLFRTDTLDQVVNDRSLIPNAINESLRYHASTGRFSRTVLKEVELHGITMKPGDRVALCLDSANRDPAKFSEPDKFIISRDTTGIAFGYGVHACIALAITKAAMNVYLNVLLDEMGKYKVLTTDNNLEYLIPASGNNDMITNIILSTDK
jgi:cytochrome P450